MSWGRFRKLKCLYDSGRVVTTFAAREPFVKEMTLQMYNSAHSIVVLVRLVTMDTLEVVTPRFPVMGLRHVRISWDVGCCLDSPVERRL